MRHRKTIEIPYTLEFEPVVGWRVDEHYGSNAWREKLIPYIVKTDKIIKSREEEPLPQLVDALVAVWCTDELPPLVVELVLKAPSVEGYTFPGGENS